MKDKKFDHIIKNKLSTLKADPSFANWEQLQDKIEFDLRSDEQFDSSISDKVGQLNMGVDSTPDWDAFSQKLHQTVEFDANIKQKLNHLPATKVSEHWLILQERLQRIRDLKQSILRIRIGESLLMICLLLCFINLSHYILPSHQVNDAQIAAVTDDSRTTIGESVEINSLAVTQQVPGDINLGQESGQKLLTANQVRSKVSSDDEVTHTVIENPVIASVPAESIQSSTDLDLPFTTNQAVTIVSNDEVIGDKKTTKTVTQNLKEQLKPIGLIPSLTTGLVSKKNATLSLWQTDQNAPFEIEKDAKGQFAIHTVVGAGIDQISTPEDDRFDLSGYQHYAVNSNIGLRLSYDVNNWSFESGISELQKGYKPKYLQDTIRVQNEAVVVSLETIDLEFISIPLTIKRSFEIGDDLSMFGLVGLEYLRITKEKYDISETNTDLSEIEKELGVVSELEYKVNSPIIKNQSLNYTIGLGVSRKLNSLIDVYGQTVYSGQLNSYGLGINQDQFKSLSIQAGIKLRLID